MLKSFPAVHNFAKFVPPVKSYISFFSLLGLDDKILENTVKLYVEFKYFA